MKVVWSPASERDYWAALEYAEIHHPETISGTISATERIQQLLLQYPESGWLEAGGYRRIQIPRTSYRMLYQLRGDEIVIQRFFHGARRWPRA